MLFSVTVKLSILATLLWVGLTTQVESLNFNYTKFQDSDRDQFIFSSNARLFLDAIQVTPDVNGASMADRSGRVVYKKPFKLWNSKSIHSSFNTTFVLNILNQTNPGGEGLAFILAADSNVPADSEGAWLGIVNSKLNGTSQAKIVAIEFDTRKSYTDDLDDNHVGLDVNSVYSRRQFSMTSRGVKISDGAKENITALVQYDSEGKILTLFVEDMEEPVFSENLDLSLYLPGEIYVGFSGSTSSETQLNCVVSWEFNGVEIDDDDKLIWVWIVVPVVGMLLLAGIAFLVYWKRKSDREKLEDAYPSIEEAIKGSSTAPRKFKLKELRKATGNFSPKNKLGKGGFGTVYKGVIGNKEMAVKKVSKKSTQGKTEFIAEVTTIGNLHHRNLVKLIGWCYERREFLLVYEYLPNGSLDKYVFYDKKSEMQELTLSWGTRLTVISGAAQALDYLHNGCEETVLHRDIKASNIMLDSVYNPKLGDFGLARTIKLSDQTHHSTKELAGTPGYMAPESILTGRFTVETDVYAFGVLILEVACGRKPGSQHEQNDYSCNIVHWVWELHKKGRVLDAADPRLNEDFEPVDMQCLLVLGLACCHPNPNKRPSMKIVLQVLKGEAPPPPVPNEKPAFMWPPLPPSFKELDISLGQISPFSEINGR
ncbi:probable L-type lectin-domain containing receptor kinase S.5 [Ricinus communis]|uniref:ATP binding protein, putative n=1 Tax=Ricinus communis TaxID=3988 RepID=B9SXJ7_RICCO|nr:probable L-type lectin-domain containing receptor kinase S.5 [Ricinus communis]EEF31670.1 ATP binding protein, putative [Ricinus communis]|eukprot:XP_002530716.1 probable L-type lectin-domain containing receptor kinase S.5 [Ricinus communis]